MITLDGLIEEYRETLADGIVKDAVRQVPSYRKAPLRQTLARVDTWLLTLAGSIRENNPKILAGYLTSVAADRQVEGYPVAELHTIVRITEDHLTTLIVAKSPDEVHQNALLVLLDAIIGAARMVLSVTYLLSGRPKPDLDPVM